MKQLENKVALITGAASGIGKACLESFLEAGAKVVFTDLNEELGEKVAKEAGSNAHFIKNAFTEKIFGVWCFSFSCPVVIDFIPYNERKCFECHSKYNSRQPSKKNGETIGQRKLCISKRKNKQYDHHQK